MLLHVGQAGFDDRIKPIDQIFIVDQHFGHLLAGDELLDLLLRLRVVAAGVILAQGARQKPAVLLQLAVKRIDLLLQNLLLRGFFLDALAQRRHFLVRKIDPQLLVFRQRQRGGRQFVFESAQRSRYAAFAHRDAFVVANLHQRLLGVQQRAGVQT